MSEGTRSAYWSESWLPPWFAWISVVTWVSCLIFPAFSHRDGSSWHSLYLLTVGWFGPAGGSLSWYANPLLWMSWFALSSRRYAVALVLSLAATVLMGEILLRPTIMVNEGGHMVPIVEYHIGYWLWAASASLMVLVAVANAVSHRSSASQAREAAPSG